MGAIKNRQMLYFLLSVKVKSIIWRLKNINIFYLFIKDPLLYTQMGFLSRLNLALFWAKF